MRKAERSLKPLNNYLEIYERIFPNVGLLPQYWFEKLINENWLESINTFYMFRITLNLLNWYLFKGDYIFQTYIYNTLNKLDTNNKLNLKALENKRKKIAWKIFTFGRASWNWINNFLRKYCLLNIDYLIYIQTCVQLLW